MGQGIKYKKLADKTIPRSVRFTRQKWRLLARTAKARKRSINQILNDIVDVHYSRPDGA
jgi:predicted DNA-binding ribbon-helix-helix protein